MKSMFAEGFERPQLLLKKKLLLLNWPFLLVITAITMVGSVIRITRAVSPVTATTRPTRPPSSSTGMSRPTPSLLPLSITRR